MNSIRIGVFICECGSNIAEKIDISRIISTVSTMKDVVAAEPYRLLCSPDGKSHLEKRIRDLALTHVVVAACSPRDHLQDFMSVCEKAGVNQYMLQMVNIREQCAWITENPADATEKAIRMVRSAIKRVRYQTPLARREISVNPDVLVVGGGISGIETSLMLMSEGRRVYLLEKGKTLGGMVQSFQRIFPTMEDFSATLAKRIEMLRANKNVTILTKHELERAVGFLGNYEIRVHSDTLNSVKDIKVGAVVLATGAELFNPSTIRGFGYGQVDNVITALEFEQMNQADHIVLKDGSSPRSLAIIHCVGREVRGYCSEICCMYALKFARYLNQKVPGTGIVHLYRDMCVPGKLNQRFMEETMKEGPKFDHCAGVRVRAGEQGPIVSYFQESGSVKEISVDMVILIPAMIPNKGSADVARILGLKLDREGFFERQHEKLSPIASAKEGIFIAGSAEGPKNISDCIVQAQATAGKILATLIPGRKMEIEARTSQISESYCQGCKSCISVCPFGAITFDERRKVAVVNEVICRGCGNCAAACPSGAAIVKHSTYDQIYQEISEAVR